MRPAQARFITACQQLLALGAVLAVLTPAASVITLDVVGGKPSETSTRHTRPGLEAYRVASDAKVPATTVKPVVREISLTASSSAKTAAPLARLTTPRSGVRTLVSVPQPVTGYGAVGVTWGSGQAPDEDQLGFEVRTRTAGAWSGWTTVEYDADHGPDPASREALRARPGTDPILVGEVDDVQVRATADGVTLPTDMKLAVIDPGTASTTRTERPAIDTSTLPSTQTSGTPTTTAVEPTKSTGAEQADALSLRAATYTPKPQIFSRAQWGADESKRDKSSLHYYEVHAGFVHHTVNANDYSRDDVPALLRGIYAYHTQSRGWSDIGYNFLVDRFGRIWEGRYGGVDRPVVGAHTLGYNDYSFAMSAIGNYETARPSDAVLRAYGALFAWKLSLHGVSASSTSQVVGPSTFAAINGHRDAASTACPGRYLYAKLSTIRAYAADDQAGWSGRELESDLGGSPHPDLIVRRASDGQAFVLPTGGLLDFEDATTMSTGWTSSDTVVATPDITGDGRGDVVVRRADGTLKVYPATSSGGLGAGIKRTTAFRNHDQITAVGDLDEDGHNDLLARHIETGRLDAYFGGGRGGFQREALTTGWDAYRTITGAGDVDGDGHVDVVAKDPGGALWLRPGNGNGKLGAPVSIPGGYGRYDALTGVGDYNRDGRDDLFARESSTGRGFVLPSRGNGTYGRALGPLWGASDLSGITGAPIGGSADPDLVGRRGGSIVLLRHAGTLDLARPINTGMNLSKANLVLNVGDWDRDGFGDVIARSSENGSLYLHRGDGAGHFGAAIRVGTGFGSISLLAAVGDMTGDGSPDLMGRAGGSMRIYPGAGLKGLKPSYLAYGSIFAADQIGVGRWDRDGSPDSLLRNGSKLRLYPGNGPGGLVNNVTTFGLDVAAYDWIIGISDATGTGHGDLIAREAATGRLWLLPGNRDGFGTRRFLGEGLGAYDLVG